MHKALQHPSTLAARHPGAAWRRWACGVALWCALAPVQALELARVQMIASYHAGMAWSDAQIAGVRGQLQARNPPLEMQLDFLDTKHVVPNAQYYQLTEALLLAKYGTKPPAVLIAADDDALDFALLLRDKHFKGTPVLFSGVSSSRRAALQQMPAVGGVFDDLDAGRACSRCCACARKPSGLW